jgi:pimeloyl-ACP methyl ester carboxylesterase
MSSTMDIIFCHGLESHPHGRKYEYLTRAGLDVRAPDFQGLALADRVAALEPILAEADKPLVIGSSYGGATALCAAIRHRERGGDLTALILCAPALGRSEPPLDSMDLYAPVPTVILHGTRDDVVPIEVSRNLAARDPNVKLIELDDVHDLSGSLPELLGAVYAFVGAP